MRSQQGFVIVFNVLDRQSFENVHRWRQDIERYARSDGIKLMILGNGCERDDVAMIMSKEEVANEVAAYDGTLYFGVSARTDTNVDKAFAALTRLIVDGDSEERASLTVDLNALRPPKDRSLLDRLFGKVRWWP